MLRAGALAGPQPPVLRAQPRGVGPGGSFSGKQRHKGRGQGAINVSAVAPQVCRPSSPVGLLGSVQGPGPNLGATCCCTQSSGMSRKAVSPVDPDQVPCQPPPVWPWASHCPRTPVPCRWRGSGVGGTVRKALGSTPLPSLCLRPCALPVTCPVRLDRSHPRVQLEEQPAEVRCAARWHSAGGPGQGSRAQHSKRRAPTSRLGVNVSLPRGAAAQPAARLSEGLSLIYRRGNRGSKRPRRPSPAGQGSRLFLVFILLIR